jgi:hypothetical protein
MSKEEVQSYWESHSHLTAERLEDHMRDEKYKQLKPDSGTTERRMSETEASFFKNTSYTVNNLLSLSARERQAIVHQWLSAQTGYTVPEVADKTASAPFGNDVYELLRHLQTDKRKSLLDVGIPMDQADELAKKRENLKTILNNYLHALESLLDMGISMDQADELAKKRENLPTILNNHLHALGYACVYACTRPPDAPVARTCYDAFAPACPHAPSPWGCFAPTSAGPGVFACVQACTCPPAGHEHCAATCGTGAEMRQQISISRSKRTNL